MEGLLLLEGAGADGAASAELDDRRPGCAQADGHLAARHRRPARAATDKLALQDEVCGRLRLSAVRDSAPNCRRAFAAIPLQAQPTADGIPTVWAPEEHLGEVLRYLKTEAREPYRCPLRSGRHRRARLRIRREGQPEREFTVVYHLLSFESQRRRAPQGRAARRAPQHRAPSPISGRPRTGTSASCGTCSASASPAIPTCADPDAGHLAGPSAAQGAPRARDRDGAVRAARRQARRLAGGADVQPEEWG